MSDQLSSDLAALQINRDEAPSRGAWKLIVLLVLIVGVAAVGWFVVYPAAYSYLYKTAVSATEISLVSPAQGSVDLTTTGYVQPQTTSKVGARIAGRLTQVLVKEGDTVKAGQLLATIDDADQLAAIRAAESKVAAARARSATARANLAETTQQAKRERELLERGASAKAAVEDLDARAHSLQAQVVAADADVKAAAAEVETLKVNLGYSKITAPIDGTVVTKPQEVGELVSPTAPNGVVELADFSTLVVETDVPEGRISMIKPGSPAEISLDAFPGKRFRGQTVEIASKVDRSKATIGVKVKFVDGNAGVLPDMAARVSFLQKQLDEGSLKEPPKLIVPADAVLDREGAKVVFVIEQGKVRMVPVEVGPAFGNGFELKTNLAPGTRVVSKPTAKLSDGQKIKEEK
jgi:HlyD family secretion protein